MPCSHRMEGHSLTHSGASIQTGDTPNLLSLPLSWFVFHGGVKCSSQKHDGSCRLGNSGAGAVLARESPHDPEAKLMTALGESVGGGEVTLSCCMSVSALGCDPQASELCALIHAALQKCVAMGAAEPQSQLWRSGIPLCSGT